MGRISTEWARLRRVRQRGRAISLLVRFQKLYPKPTPRGVQVGLALVYLIEAVRRDAESDLTP